MFTDMVGFTSLTQQNEALALEVLDQHNRLLRAIFPKYHGSEIKAIGDSFLVEFDSALEATSCAIEIQRTLDDYNASADTARQLHVRIGVHLGDVVHAGGDVFGDAVNIASRIEPLADPDGICVSEPVHEQVRNKLDVPFEPLPPSSLKNIATPIGTYRVRWTQIDGNPPAATLAPPETHRLAVLPFSNLSPDPNDEFFADGLTEELITELARLPGVQVIARTSVMRFKGAAKGIREVGRELGVQVALEGSVRKSGNRLRITAQLVDARSEAHLWADRYDRELTEIFGMQSEIAASVATALRLQLAPHERTVLARSRTGNLEAYQNYLRGRQFWWLAGEANYRSAIRYFENAIELDRKFALAYCGLADSYALLGNHGFVPLSEALETAERAARTALQLDPDLADAHVSLAPVLYNRYDWNGAVAELRRAVELDPNNVLGHYWLAVAVSVTGDLDAALEIARQGAVLDPLSRQSVLQPSVFLYLKRDYQGSLDYLDEVEHRLGLHTAFYRGLCELFLGRIDHAVSHLEEAATSSFGTIPVRQAGLTLAYFRSGRESEGRPLLERLSESARGGRTPAGVVAWIYAGIGDIDGAFEWFDRAYAERSVLGVEDLKVDPFYDGLRKDSRFPALLRKFNH